MENVVDLDYLLQRKAAPKAGVVSLLGVTYDVLNADVLEDFLIVMGSVDRYLSEAETVLHGEIKAEAMAASAKSAAGKIIEVRDQAHRCVKMLAPGIPDAVLAEHFSSLQDAQALFFALVKIVREAASPGLKKNCDGMSQPSQEKPEPGSHF